MASGDWAFSQAVEDGVEYLQPSEAVYSIELCRRARLLVATTKPDCPLRSQIPEGWRHFPLGFAFPLRS
jgi:hypothetical protein